MSTPLIRCARWGALGVGIVYGYVHRRSLTQYVAEKKMQEEYRRKEQLIAQAKAEYAKRYRPATTGGVITDPDDPNFDLEAFLQHVDATQP